MIASSSIAACLLAGLASSPAAQEMPSFKPLPQHKLLARDVGVWTGTMKMYMAGPDAPPMAMPVKETNTLMQGGLWVLSSFESGPFKGKGQFGYDPVKKKFIGTWLDSTAPYMSLMEGEHNEKTGEMIMYSTGIDPQTQKPQKMKSVAKYVGESGKEFVMYTQTADQKWVKSFEIMYKKTK